jgi:hypothetical protein
LLMWPNSNSGEQGVVSGLILGAPTLLLGTTYRAS